MVEKLLRKFIPHKELGWEAINEKFTRYSLLKTPWFNIYLHQLDARIWHPNCHDHPWWFLTVLLWNGYFEQVGTQFYNRRPGNVLYRPASFSHNIVTPNGTSWSLVVTGRKSRDWGFHPCDTAS